MFKVKLDKNTFMAYLALKGDGLAIFKISFTVV